MGEVKITEWKEDPENPQGIVIEAHHLGKRISPLVLAAILEARFNGFESPVHWGEIVGGAIGAMHRTLQGVVINFFIAVLVYYGKHVKEIGSDARNEVAMKSAVKISDAFSKEEIRLQPFI